jgi:hypothetical protein
MPIKRYMYFLLWCAFLLVTSACQPADTSTPTITPVVASTTAPSASIKAATPTPLPALLTTATIELAPFTIHLPTQWPVLHAGDARWDAQLQQLQRTNPHLEHYLQKLLPAALAGTKISLAWSPSPPADTLVVVAVAPADGLTLAGYLRAVTEELEQSRLTVGSAVTIQQAQIEYDLHQAGLPLALIHYTLTPKTKEQKIVGYQAALLDSQTNHLLLLTLITPDPPTAEAQALITSIFRTIAVE